MEISWIEAIETIGVPAVGAGGLGYLVWVLFKSLITGVNKTPDGKYTYNVSYDKGEGKTKVPFL